MFNVIQQRCLSYYNEIPVDTFPTIAKSAIFSFMISITRGELKLTSIEQYTRPLIAAGIAAVAALVHAILSPIFNTAFGNNNQITQYQEIMKSILVTGLTRVLLGYATNQRVDVMKTNWGAISFLSINLIKSAFYSIFQISDLLGYSHGETLNLAHIAHRWGMGSPDGSNSTYIVFN